MQTSFTGLDRIQGKTHAHIRLFDLVHYDFGKIGRYCVLLLVRSFPFQATELQNRSLIHGKSGKPIAVFCCAPRPFIYSFGFQLIWIIPKYGINPYHEIAIVN